jgi:hypothetical protein
LADLLDPLLTGTFLKGFEDFLSLIAIFCVCLGLMRAVANAMAPKQIQYPDGLQRLGGAVFGLATGYFVAGFLLCAMQTLPWHQNFMAFEPLYESGPEHTIRQVLPPDRVWLGLMYRAGAVPFATSDIDDRYTAGTTTEKHFTFDKFGTFELRYARFRRWDNAGAINPYQGEFAEQLRGPPR